MPTVLVQRVENTKKVERSTMEHIGVNGTLFSMQLLHFTLVVRWPLLAVAAMISSRRGGLTGMPLFGWVLLVVLVPLLGALACLIVRPTDHPTDARHRDPDQGNRDGEA